MLPENIKSFRLPSIRNRKIVYFDEPCGEPSDDDEFSSGDFFENENGEIGKKKNEKLTSKRVLAFFMLFPMLATGLVMLYEFFGKYKFQNSAMQSTAAIGGAIIALMLMSKVAALKSAIKFISCFAWIIFLVPTYQVYKCSPIELKNDMLGTWFSLKTNSAKLLESSYVTSVCFRSLQFHSPYVLSVMSPKVVLIASVNDLINLDMDKEIPDEDASRMLSYFMLVSKRSVKKKFHKLYINFGNSTEVCCDVEEFVKVKPT